MAKPVVDRIERDLGERVRVLRIGVMGDVGRQLAVRYGVRGVPILMVLDGEGEVVLAQAGVPRRGEILAVVEELVEQGR